MWQLESQCADAAFGIVAAALDLLILIEIKAPVADIQAPEASRAVLSMRLSPPYRPCCPEIRRGASSQGSQRSGACRTARRTFVIFQQPGALFIVLFPAKGGISELLRKPGDFVCSKLSVCGVLALSEP